MIINGRKISIRRERLNSGGYTAGKYGKYFGAGAPLFLVEDDETGEQMHLRARDRAVAIEMIRLDGVGTPFRGEVAYFWEKVQRQDPEAFRIESVTSDQIKPGQMYHGKIVKRTRTLHSLAPSGKEFTTVVHFTDGTHQYAYVPAHGYGLGGRHENPIKRCNCENSICAHVPGACSNQVHGDKVIGLGDVCPTCYRTTRSEYRIKPQAKPLVWSKRQVPSIVEAATFGPGGWDYTWEAINANYRIVRTDVGVYTLHSPSGSHRFDTVAQAKAHAEWEHGAHRNPMAISSTEKNVLIGVGVVGVAALVYELTKKKVT